MLLTRQEVLASASTWGGTRVGEQTTDANETALEFTLPGENLDIALAAIGDLDARVVVHHDRRRRRADRPGAATTTVEGAEPADPADTQVRLRVEVTEATPAGAGAFLQLVMAVFSVIGVVATVGWIVRVVAPTGRPHGATTTQHRPGRPARGPAHPGDTEGATAVVSTRPTPPAMGGRRADAARRSDPRRLLAVRHPRLGAGLRRRPVPPHRRRAGTRRGVLADLPAARAPRDRLPAPAVPVAGRAADGAHRHPLAVGCPPAVTRAGGGRGRTGRQVHPGPGRSDRGRGRGRCSRPVPAADRQRHRVADRAALAGAAHGRAALHRASADRSGAALRRVCCC